MIELLIRDTEPTDVRLIYNDLSEDGFNLKESYNTYHASIQAAIELGETCTLAKLEDGVETVLGVFSILPLYSETGFLVSFLTNESKQYLLKATHLLKLTLSVIAKLCKYKTITADVCTRYPKYINWAKKYGFKPNGLVTYSEISSNQFLRMSYGV